MSRAHALSEDQRSKIWDLHLRRVPQLEIARQVGCSRNTVNAVVQRITKDLADRRLDQLETAREEALATYDAIQREAWMRLEQCAPTSTIAVGYLGTIVDCQRQKDRLLGLEQLTINHTGVYLARIEALMDRPATISLPGDSRTRLGDEPNEVNVIESQEVE